MNPLLIGGVLMGVVYLISKRTKTTSKDGFVSPNFSYAELTTTSTGLPNTPNEDELNWLNATATEILEPIRQQFGTIIVNSGYRSQEVNTRVGGSPTSQHRLGQAADIISPSYTPHDMAIWLYNSDLPVRQVIIYPPSAGNFLHVSIDPARPAKRQFLISNGAFQTWTPDF